MVFCCMRWHTCGGNTGNGSIIARISLNVVLCVGGLTDVPTYCLKEAGTSKRQTPTLCERKQPKNLRKREKKHNMTLV